MRTDKTEGKDGIGLVVIFLVLLTMFTQVRAEDQQTLVFSTWKGFEVDKCSSIWLLNKILNHKPEFRFYPKTEEIKEGVLFDTPDAEFRRYFNMSTYESFLKHYQVKDPKLLYIGRIIHDIEVNTWEKKVFKETIGLRDAVNQIIQENSDERSVILKTSQYFDEFYEKLNL